MSDKKYSKAGVIVGLLMSAGIFSVAGWLFLNHQYVSDQLSVWSFTPSSNITTIEDKAAFSSKGLFYFRASQPVIADAESFNKDCPRQETGSPILGCYVGGRIFVFDITNEKLDGMEEVTAAHEMLHAAWERMSPTEQQKIGSMLLKELDKISDQDLKTRLEYYERTEPGELQNELHSIIGTEVISIDPELETYYRRYFDDRTKILALHEQYSAVFTTLRAQADAEYKELTELAQSIQTRTAEYQSNGTALTSDIESFNRKANNGQFTSSAQFYAQRNALIARSNQLAADRTAINTDITLYETKYAAYQKLSKEIEGLNKSLDSIKALEPAPSLQ